MKIQSNQMFWRLSSAFSILFMAILAGLAMGLYDPILQSNAVMNYHELLLPLRVFTCIFSGIAILDLWLSFSLRRVFHTRINQSNNISSSLRLLYSFGLLYSLSKLWVLCFYTQIEGIQIHDAITFFKHYWSLSLIIFGLHLIVLSRVLCYGQFGPKFLSILLMIAGCCYSIHHILNSFVDAYASYKNQVDAIIALPCALSELLLAYYLWKFRSSNDFSSDSTQ